MAWTLEGTYFENCSCDTICPCTWSGLTAPATHDRCYAMLAFHIDRGEIEGVDVGGLTFALVVDSPPVMADGNWKVGVVLDGAASEEQAGALGRVVGGQLGGPPAMLGPLLGEMAGIEKAPAAASGSSASIERPAFQLTRQNVAVLGVAALAWAGIIAYARDMGNGAGTMGIPVGEFVVMWALMMTAMMLPAVAPVAALYLR